MGRLGPSWIPATGPADQLTRLHPVSPRPLLKPADLPARLEDSGIWGRKDTRCPAAAATPGNASCAHRANGCSAKTRNRKQQGQKQCQKPLPVLQTHTAVCPR
ncbi:hypothetical protein NDU88_007153 [Pleurodeles waltl]|uniref:Uncharacterized protein n=1 Tax=Pleurodeles waltl TaxID=8319 RepID=A0AAV7UN34_PLEWA|nr:hypothetical protein NDU88_007153 [Pleurodeles waltl]